MTLEHFNQTIDRRGTGSVKWDLRKTMFGSDDVLPMFVADMDFPPPAAVTEALQHRVEKAHFGYTVPTAVTEEAIAGWLERRFNYAIKPEQLVYSIGVVPSIATCVNALTKPGDRVLTLTPVYYPFFDMTEKNNRTIVTSPLNETNGRYEIDWDDFEEKLQTVAMFLFCSPHNPVGRVWTKDELTRINELCVKHNVIVVSDEIHADLVFEPNVHTPLAVIAGENDQHIVTLQAPSKTFNLAGLQASYMVVPCPDKRQKIKETQGAHGHFTINTLGITALEAAYTKGEEWLEQLLTYLRENIRLVEETVRELDGVSLVPIEGTYLLWIDCRQKGWDDEELKKRLLETGKLALEPGNKFRQGGEGFVRMNIACPRELVIEGLKRFKRAMEE